MNKKSIADLTEKDLAGKKVLVRVDFNVPLDANQNITDETRIVASLPTLKYLIDNKAKVIIASHLGRPKGSVKEEFRLTPIVDRLSKLLGKKVVKADDCIGEQVEKLISEMNDSDVLLLENVRFYKEETTNEEIFAKKLADLCDIFVNDAFGTSHRAHASTEGVAHFKPAYAGFLIQKELDVMGKALADPKRPLVAIIGGAKVSSKIDVLKHLLDKVDQLIIGGGMTYTFLKVQGYEIGKSLFEESGVDAAKVILNQSKVLDKPILFPKDFVVANDISADAKTAIVPFDQIPKDEMALDIGPESIKNIVDVIKTAGTVIWNGPVGVFEIEQFATGTNAICRALAESKAISIIGGGDSASAAEKSGYADKMTHISTGGGASLEFMEGKELPGIAVLQDK